LRLTRRELALGVVWSVLAAIGGALGAVLSREAYRITHWPDSTSTASAPGFNAFRAD